MKEHTVFTKIFTIQFCIVFLLNINYVNCGLTDGRLVKQVPSNILSKRVIFKEGDNVKINVTSSSVYDKHPNGELIFDCELTLAPATVTPIEIHDINSEYLQKIDFGIIQVHVGYRYKNISLSYNQTLIPNYYQTGRHLGLIIYGRNDDSYSSETVYIHNLSNGNESETSNVETVVMIAYIVYYRNNRVPVPGGCNLEYSMVQDAPVIILHQSNGIVQVDTPLAAPPSTNQSVSQCDSRATNKLIYESRYLFLPSDSILSTISNHEYFNYIRLILTVDDARKNGILASSYYIPLNRRLYLTFPGWNILFVTIVRLSSNVSSEHNAMAAYVPTLYSWDYFNSTDMKMWHQSRLLWIVFATAILIIGLIKGFVNNQNTPMAVQIIFIFINIYICMTLVLAILYMILSNEQTNGLTNQSFKTDVHLINMETIIPLALVISIVIFLCCGCCGGCVQTSPLDSAVEPFKQAVQYLSLQFTIVFFITSFIIYYCSSNGVACTPEMYGIYWVFVSAIIMVAMPTVIGWYWNELILNAMWGSFLLTIAIAIYMQNPLQIICIFSIRFIMDTSDYRKSLTPPIGVEELLLFAIWKILSIIGSVVQHNQYKKIRQTQWRAQQQRNRSTVRYSGNTAELERTPKTFAMQMRSNEQTPLLRRERLMH